MTYASDRKKDLEPHETINPIWRGIGCILMVVAPITSLAVANIVIESGYLQQYIYFPPRLLRPVTVPFFNYTITSFLASLALAAVMTFILFAIYFTVYAAMYRVAGPSRYGPYDARPQRKGRKRRKSR